MTIADRAIKLILNNTRAKNRLAAAFICSIHTIERWIRDNQENGDLTKVTAIQIISEETGLNYQEILEDYTVETLNDGVNIRSNNMKNNTTNR